MKLLKSIANKFGYNLTRIHKSTTLDEIIKARIKKNKCDALIDVGGNIGDFFLKYHSYFDKTYVFETNKIFYDFLNKKIIQTNNIKFYQNGVGERNEYKKFILHQIKITL